MKIQILKGPIRSGKTSWLQKKYSGSNNVAGILSPVINNKRHFLNLDNNETQPMEAGENEEEALVVGRYKFSSKSFNWASNIILNSITKSKELLIIDEIGPLELQGKGFAEVLKKILQSHNEKIQLVIVVRENCLEEVIKYFGIDEKEVELIVL